LKLIRTKTNDNIGAIYRITLSLRNIAYYTNVIQNSLAQ